MVEEDEIDLQKQLERRETEFAQFKEKTKDYVLQLREQLNTYKEREATLKSQARSAMQRLTEKHEKDIKEREAREEEIMNESQSVIQKLKQQHEEELQRAYSERTNGDQTESGPNNNNASILKILADCNINIPEGKSPESFTMELIKFANENKHPQKTIESPVPDISRIRNILVQEGISIHDGKSIDEQLVNLENGLKELIKRTENATLVDEDSKDSQDDLHNEIATLKTKVSELEAFDKKRDDKESDLTQMSVELRSQLNSLTLSLKEQEAQINAKAKEIQKLQRDLEESHTRAVAVENQLREQFQKDLNSRVNSCEKNGIAQLESLKEEHSVVVAKLTRELKQCVEELEEQSTSFAECKNQLRICESERDHALEEAKNAREELENSIEDINKQREDLKKQRESAETELRSMDAMTADALASASDLKSKSDMLQAELQAVTKEANENKRKAKSYVESLVQKSKTDLAALKESCAEEREQAIHSLQTKYESEIELVKSQYEEQLRTVQFELEQAQNEITMMEQKTSEVIASTQQKSEAIRSSELEMQSIIKAKETETDKYKRLRQAAKTETLTLAKKIEAQDALLNKVDVSVRDNILPGMEYLARFVKDAEYHLNATLAVRDSQETASNSGAVESRVETTELTPINAEIEEEEEKQRGGSLAKRSSSFFDSSVTQLEDLQEKLSSLIITMRGLVRKIQEVCSLAIPNNEPLPLLQYLRSYIENCLRLQPKTTRRPYTRVHLQESESVV